MSDATSPVEDITVGASPAARKFCQRLGFLFGGSPFGYAVWIIGATFSRPSQRLKSRLLLINPLRTSYLKLR
jgi:hypothetical protein